MEISVTGKLLVCFLLVLAHARIFFVKRERTDAVSFLALLAFVTAVLDFMAYGAGLFSLSLLALSFFSLLANGRAMLRSLSGLLVDRYSAPFSAFSVGVLLLAVALAAGVFYFAPAKFPVQKFSVREETVRLAGSFRSGFVETKPFEKPTAFLTFYAGQENLGGEKNGKAETPVVIVLGDKRGSLRSYAPYMFFLAQEGCDVVFGDFFASESNYLNSALDSKLLRLLALRLKFFRDKSSAKRFAEKYNYLCGEELKVLVKFAREKFGREKKIFLVGDELTALTCGDFERQHQDEVAGFFLLNGEAEYRTVGHGFIEATDPLAARYFFGLPKAKDFLLPQTLAQKTAGLLAQSAPQDDTQSGEGK